MWTAQTVSMSERNASRRADRKAREQRPRDVTGKWKREVLRLNERLGFPEGFLWHWFDQLAMCSEFECRIPRGDAERMGFRLLRGMFDKVELGMECN